MDIEKIKKKVLGGGDINREEAMFILKYPHLDELLEHTQEITTKLCGRKVYLCSIVNARSGLCPEDCAFCAQSTKFKTEVRRYPLLPQDEIIKIAKRAKKMSAECFGIVIAAKGPTDGEVERICEMIGKVRELGLEPDASCGMLKKHHVEKLVNAGLVRYNHNIETSRRFFPKICSTHSFDDRLRNIKLLKDYGVMLCTGCIFGLGESDEDRVDIAFTIREIDPETIPVNFLIPIRGTPLGRMKTIHYNEALSCLAMMRFVNPTKRIKVAGGREFIFGERQYLIFRAGANSIIIGDYLTTRGQSYESDHKMIKDAGLYFAPFVK